MLRDQNTE